MALFDFLRSRSPPARARISEPTAPARIYAIGDVHGCLSELRQLEAQIQEDAGDIPGEKWIVTLGDHMDRGPDSAGVLEYLLVTPPGWRRFCLAGNHEAAMLDFLQRPHSDHQWLRYGGLETLASFGMPPDQILQLSTKRSRWQSLLAYWVPQHVRDFLAEMPVLIETPSHFFVHAGLEPNRPVAAQSDDTLMNFRDDGTDYSGLSKTVVHGHTIRKTAEVAPWRVSLDTGAFATGVLSAAAIVDGHPVRILSTPPSNRLAPPITT